MILIYDTIAIIILFYTKLLGAHPSTFYGNYACQINDLITQREICNHLIANGADINIKNDEGNTSLNFAIQFENLAIAISLIEKGADINTQDNDGCTPLHLYIKLQNLKAVELLIEKEANINIQDNEGLSLLHYASMFGLIQILELLIKNGSNLQSQDKYGNTAMHDVANKLTYINTFKIMELIIKSGTDRNIKNNDGQTAIDNNAILSEDQKEALKNIQPDRQLVIENVTNRRVRKFKQDIKIIANHTVEKDRYIVYQVKCSSITKIKMEINELNNNPSREEINGVKSLTLTRIFVSSYCK